MTANATRDVSSAAGRRWSAAAGAVLVVETIALAVILATHPHHRMLPVTVGFAEVSGRITLSHVDVGVAAVILCAVQGVARLVTAARRPRVASGSQGNRSVIDWAQLLVVGPVTVFLIAQLNGVVDLGALVLIYAIASGTVLAAFVQERLAGPSRLPLAVGAMVGIVPWGVIAFQQVGAGVAGGVVAPGIRLVTVLLLAASMALFALEWRARGRLRGAGPRRSPSLAGALPLALQVVATSLFAWFAALGLS